MEIKSVPLKGKEYLYTYRNSKQISSQTGLIGYIRADMGAHGAEFFSTWNGFRDELNTQDFKDEIDTVINLLRKDGGFLSNRDQLEDFCINSDNVFAYNTGVDYGVRVNTKKYAFLMRLNPYKGNYNLYCYCYVKDWLNGHMKDAAKGIRFINSHYKELFRIPDGGKIKIHLAWNEDQVRTCRYIDDYHVEVGDNLYHICEFAERMEQNGHTYEPVRTELPEQCYSILPGSGEIIVVKRNEKGYYNPHIPAASKEQAREIVDEYNGKLGVTRAQEEAMRTGSMFGFHVPGADPKNYDKDGKPLPPKDRGDAR